MNKTVVRSWFLPFALLFWSLACNGEPATSLQPGAAWKLRSVQVEGLESYRLEQILRVAGIKLGQPITARMLDQLRDRLLATGAFASVAYEYSYTATGELDLKWQLSEVTPRYPFDFEELPLDARKCRNWLAETEPLYAEEIPATEVFIRRMARSIEDYLKTQGQAITVRGEIVRVTGERFVILFSPDRPRPSIADVRISGSQVIPGPELQRIMADVAVGEPFVKRRFQEMLEANLRPLFEMRGRMRAQFTIQKVEPAENVQGIVVYVHVDDGPEFQPGTLKIDPGDLGPEEANKIGGAPERELQSFEQLREIVTSIQERLKRFGYLKGHVELTRHIDDASRKVSFVAEIQPGAQYTFRQLHIQGLDIVAEAAVRRLWTLKPGESFDATYPEFFSKEIQRREMFDNLTAVRPLLHVDEKQKAVDVTLIFQ